MLRKFTKVCQVEALETGFTVLNRLREPQSDINTMKIA
jgi:hypothetical protein